MAGRCSRWFEIQPLQRSLPTTNPQCGFTFEMPVGTPKALQGNGDGEFNLFVTGGTQIMDNGHWISAAGIRLPSIPTMKALRCIGRTILIAAW